MAKKRSYIDRAYRSRRIARIARILSLVFLVLAVAFAAIFLYSGMTYGDWTITLLTSSLILASSAMTVRSSSSGFENHATIYEQADRINPGGAA